MRNCSTRSLIWLLLALAPSFAAANITLSNAILVFQPDERPVQTIGVINIDDSRTFAIKTQVSEVIHPGQKELQQIIDTRALAVAPNAFEVSAQQTRNVRLLLRERNTGDKERVFRVTFTPETPSRTEVRETPEGITTRVDIIVGMGALILVPPEKVDYQLTASRDGKTLYFNNQSNVSTEIQPRTLCKDEENCFRFNGTRLYPNTDWSFDLPEGFETIGLTLSVRAAGKYSSIEFPPLKD
jgi:P pilus assembly chaperone PapD